MSNNKISIKPLARGRWALRAPDRRYSQRLAGIAAIHQVFNNLVTDQDKILQSSHIQYRESSIYRFAAR
jgi:hypothetical protein